MSRWRLSSVFTREEPILCFHESIEGPSGVSGVREVLRKGDCLLKNERATGYLSPLTGKTYLTRCTTGMELKKTGN